MKKTILILFLAFTIHFSLQAQSSGLIKDGAELSLVSDQFIFTEGPAVDKKGNVYFTDQPNDKIWKYSTKKALTVLHGQDGPKQWSLF